MTDIDFRPGDWVTITARITELHPNCVDLGVELFSKTDQYTAFVHYDRCTPTDKPLPEEPGVGSVALLNGRAYQRVSGVWVAANGTERLHWETLHSRGDVEVIHESVSA
jgi:hypothetical protein